MHNICTKITHEYTVLTTEIHIIKKITIWITEWHTSVSLRIPISWQVLHTDSSNSTCKYSDSSVHENMLIHSYKYVGKISYTAHLQEIIILS